MSDEKIYSKIDNIVKRTRKNKNRFKINRLQRKHVSMAENKINRHHRKRRATQMRKKINMMLEDLKIGGREDKLNGDQRSNSGI